MSTALTVMVVAGDTKGAARPMTKQEVQEWLRDQYTPIVPDNNEEFVIIADGSSTEENAQIVALVCKIPNAVDTAFLFAAAPEMFAALRGVLAYSEKVPILDKKVLASVAKAVGLAIGQVVPENKDGK